MRLRLNFRRLLRSFGKRRAMKREIDEELRFHLEQRTAENVAKGMLLIGICFFIERRQTEVVEKILRHCGLWEEALDRDPPSVPEPAVG